MFWWFSIPLHPPFSMPNSHPGLFNPFIHFPLYLPNLFQLSFTIGLTFARFKILFHLLSPPKIGPFRRKSIPCFVRWCFTESAKIVHHRPFHWHRWSSKCQKQGGRLWPSTSCPFCVSLSRLNIHNYSFPPKFIQNLFILMSAKNECFLPFSSFSFIKSLSMNMGFG
jgi:hypothetical protein